jgi:hypothetical protein
MASISEIKPANMNKMIGSVPIDELVSVAVRRGAGAKGSDVPAVVGPELLAGLTNANAALAAAGCLAGWRTALV